MKLTNEQIKFLEEHNIELVLEEMKVTDDIEVGWVSQLVICRDKNYASRYLTIDGQFWSHVREIHKFELTREKVLEWANHEEQQDTCVMFTPKGWELADYWLYSGDFGKYLVRQNGENRPLPEVVEEWFRGREE